MICEVEVFKYFNKVMGAMPEKTKKKKLKVKKKNKIKTTKTKETLRSKQKETQRERQHFLQRNVNLRFYYICFQYLFSIFGFSLITSAYFGGLKISFL